jgi:hypothetical protein
MLKSFLKKTYNKLPFIYKDVVQHDVIRTYLKSGRIPWTTGYSEYKYKLIGDVINSDTLSTFSKGTLPSGYGYRIDERIVEYPWFFSNVRHGASKLLDAGSVLNFSQIIGSDILKSKKLYISTLDYEGIQHINPAPSYIYEDLRDTCFKNDFFDDISCISTLEHVGMDNTMLYTSDESKKESSRYSYLKVLAEFSRILKKDGTLYLTVPYGKYKNFGWFQIFDAGMIERTLDTFNPARAEKTYFKYENDQWNFSNEASCKDGDFFDINTQEEYEADFLAGARCVICLKIIK